MKSFRSTVFLALLLIAVPAIAGAQSRTALGLQPADTQPTSVYWLHAHQGDLFAPDTELVFEYRDGDRVIARDSIRVDLGSADGVPVGIPQAGLRVWQTADLGDPRLYVYAADQLIDVLDRQAFAARGRQLRLTHGDALNGLAGGADSLAVARPGTQERIECNSPCGGTCTPSGDYDCDGVVNSVDNCTDDYNPNQANCDGDSYGDACDFNGIFQPTGPVETCMTDKDHHGLWVTWEHHVEQRQVDVSACNQPDRWNRWIRSEGGCSANYSPMTDCCFNAISSSIAAIGDDPILWCDYQYNTDYCH